MSPRTLTILSASLGLACAGCVVQPPPPAMVVSPAAPQTAQAAQAPATCREFQQTITVGGSPQEAYGTTCLQPDGSWKVVRRNRETPPSAPQVAAAPVYPAYAYPYPYYYPAYGYGPAVYGGFYVRGGGRWR